MIKHFAANEIRRIEELSATLSLERIANYYSLTLEEFEESIIEQPEIVRAYKKGLANSILSVNNVMYRKALGGDFNAGKYWLDKMAGFEKQEDTLFIEPMKVTVAFDDAVAVNNNNQLADVGKKVKGKKASK